MQFKRWRLVPGKSLVNAGLGLGLFFLAACGGSQTDQADAPALGQETLDDFLTLPAVWSTSELEGRVLDLALASGGATIMAIAYEERGVELFNLDGEPIAPSAPLSLRAIADGTFVDFGDAVLIVFPAVSDAGELVAIVYGDGLVGPQQIDLPIAAEDVLGLCARRLITGGGVLELAYWTSTDWEALQRGTITIDGSEFDWVPGGTEPRNDGGCTLTSNGPVSAGVGSALAAVERPGATYIITLEETGAVTAGIADAPAAPVALRDGLSVRAPVRPTAIAALGRPLGGGYPEGVIVLSGADGYRDRAVFVDAGALSELTE